MYEIPANYSIAFDSSSQMKVSSSSSPFVIMCQGSADMPSRTVAGAS